MGRAAVQSVASTPHGTGPLPIIDQQLGQGRSGRIQEYAGAGGVMRALHGAGFARHRVAPGDLAPAGSQSHLPGPLAWICQCAEIFQLIDWPGIETTLLVQEDEDFDAHQVISRSARQRYGDQACQKDNRSEFHREECT